MRAAFQRPKPEMLELVILYSLILVLLGLSYSNKLGAVFHERFSRTINQQACSHTSQFTKSNSPNRHANGLSPANPQRILRAKLLQVEYKLP